jgi:phage gpG-like protein
MVSFTYSDNSQAVDKALANFQAALADERPALQAIADDFRALIARQFSTEGRAEGTPWPPRVGAGLAPPSKRAMQASPLLVRTGALRNSLIEPHAPDHVEQIDATSLTFGTRVPYALFHQFGTRRMPARPLIVLSGERAERLLEIVRGGMEEKGSILGAAELSGSK